MSGSAPDLDWNALAWQRLGRIRSAHPELQTVDMALAHRVVGPVVRAHAAQLRRAAQPCPRPVATQPGFAFTD